MNKLFQSHKIPAITTMPVASFWCLFVVGILFAVIFKLNTLVPYGAEDYALMLEPTIQTAGTLEKADHVLARIVEQFLTWNSRIGDQLAIIFLAYNKAFFNVVNSLVFLSLVFLLGKMSDIVGVPGRPEPRTITTTVGLVAFALVILLFPALGEVFFWLTGSTNYLWSNVVLLAFVYRYWILTIVDPKSLSGPGWILLILHGLLAGLTNENTVPVVILLIGIVLYDLRRRGVDLRQMQWPVWGFGALIGGYCILLFSPSTWIRLAYFKRTLAIPDHSADLYWHRLLAITAKWWELFAVLMLLILVLSALLAVLWHKGLINQGVHKGLRWVGLFYFLSHISVGLLIFVPYVENRAFTLLFGASVVMILALGRTLAGCRFGRYIMCVSVFVVTGLAAWTMQSIYETYEDFYQEAQQREKVIMAAASKGIREVAVHEYKTVDSRVVSTGEKWLTAQADWLYGNQVYARHYGVDIIEILPYRGNRYFPQVCKNSERVAGNFDVIEQNAQFVHLGGWAVAHNANMENWGIFVVLVATDGKTYVYDTRIQTRPDVVKFFSQKGYRNSGFVVMVPKRELPPGEYKLSVGVQENGNRNELLMQQVGNNLRI